MTLTNIVSDKIGCAVLALDEHFLACKLYHSLYVCRLKSVRRILNPLTLGRSGPGWLGFLRGVVPR